MISCWRLMTSFRRFTFLPTSPRVRCVGWQAKLPLGTFRAYVFVSPGPLSAGTSEWEEEGGGERTEKEEEQELEEEEEVHVSVFMLL